ncbi:MAG TPA: metallophosphoesterase family protein [Gaiellaceae bacterium]|nr:metallophosphoesterase family protein [Gaiellaceae bacterium]
MPLALVSDIHGSYDALSAVLDDLARLGIERAVCLGDAVQGGDQPREVLDRLAELGWPVILGNADDFLLDVPEHAPEEITEAQLAKREWTLAQLDGPHLEQIRAFAPTLDLELDDGLTLRAFHGSPTSYDDVVLPDTPDAQVERLLGGSGVDLLAGGHTHRQWARVVDGALYVNPGAVMSEIAEYALLTGGSVEFRKVAWRNAS